MEKLGFVVKWMELTMQCVTSVTYSIKINGKPNITPSKRPFFTLSFFAVCRRFVISDFTGSGVWPDGRGSCLPWGTQAFTPILC